MARTEDSHLAKQAQATDHQATALGTAAAAAEDKIPEPFPAVAVRDEAAAAGIARVIVLSGNNQVLPLLPQDPRRRTAILLAIDNDVYLSTQEELAQAVAGNASGVEAAYLPAGVPVPWPSRAALWAACTTTATSTRITVLIARDDQ